MPEEAESVRPPKRFRCTACGNLTRFDVRLTRTTEAFWHYEIGGNLTVEDEEVKSETIEVVSCRWCGTGKDVVEIDQVEPKVAPSE